MRGYIVCAVLVAAVAAAGPVLSKNPAPPTIPVMGGMSWQDRERFIVQAENEKSALENQLFFATFIPTALLVVGSAYELGEWYECLHGGHTFSEIPDVQKKIDEYLHIRDQVLPMQWDYLRRQLANKDPAEWRRFQQEDIPYQTKQKRLKQQAATMKKPSCPAKPKQPQQTTNPTPHTSQVPQGNQGPQAKCVETGCLAISEQVCGYVEAQIR